MVIHYYIIIFRLLFDWSIVEIAHTQYSVCEDTGIVSIKVVRGGSQTSRSSVRVEAEQMSALEGFDYVIKSRSTVTFEPGCVNILLIYY